MKTLSIVIPVYNEEESVLTLASEVSSALDNQPYDWECLWVNDGSADNTGDVLREYSETNPRHRVIELDSNYGQSAAIWIGIDNAKGEIIGTLDGDGQNDPAEFPRLLQRLEMGDVDIVNGHRTNRRDNFVRRASSRIANGFRRFFTGDKISDIGCALRVFRAHYAKDLPCFKAFHRFVPVLMGLRGAKMCELPVNHRPRERGISKYGIGNRLWVGLADTFAMCWMRRRLVWPRKK